jgi:hypothetical protein
LQTEAAWRILKPCGDSTIFPLSRYGTRKKDNPFRSGEKMHILKIISGGGTSAERAALDVAMALGIDHAGGHLDGGPVDGDPVLAEKNARTADGTVVFSQGPPAGDDAVTAPPDHWHGKPRLFVDLSRVPPLKASGRVHRWVAAKGLGILNVTGTGVPDDPANYPLVYRALWGLLALDAIDGEPAAAIKPFPLKIPAPKMLIWPDTLEELVDFLSDGLPFRQRFIISQMNEKQLAGVHAVLGGWIQETFGFGQGNDKLLKSVETWTFRETTSPEDATWVVIRALSSRLRRTQRLC